MGKIGYSSVTLTDLTETLPVTLVLETSLDQNIQTKVGNLYTPNFEEKELIITPSLFLGQEEILFSKHPEYLKPESETDSGYLYYEIGDTIYKWTGNFNSSIYVDNDGKLHIKENFSKNTTIEAYIEDFYEPTHNYTIDLISRVNPIDILFLEEGNNNYYAIIECSDGREHFEDTNTTAITMTAKLYQGIDDIAKQGDSRFTFSWEKLSDGDNITEGVNKTLTIQRKDIVNRELFTCTIYDTETEIDYIAKQFIYDFTDVYRCNISYNKPLLLSENNPEVKLSASVWLKDKTLESIGGYNLTYQWFVIGVNQSTETPLGTGKDLTIKINGTNIPKNQVFTVLCRVSHKDGTKNEDGTDKSYVIAIDSVDFHYVPEYSVRIAPKEIFIPTSFQGAYQGNTNKTYTFSFQLLDKNGSLLNYNSSDSVSAGTDTDGTKISFTSKTSGKWDFTGTIVLNTTADNSLWGKNSSTLGSKIYEFSYTYYGQVFSEEINVVKNKVGQQGIQGVQGTQGFSGYTVDLSNEFHAFSGGEGHADPNQSTSCKISAYYGSEGRTIQSIKLDSQTVYQLNTTSSLITYHSSDYGYLYIQARKEQDHIIELTIRTNNSTTEAGKFLKGIRPLSFDVTILNTKNENLVFPKVFTYTINYNGKSYSLIPSHNFIKYSEAEGTYEPSKITASATMRQESGEAVTYSGAKIIYSFDGNNWKNYTTSGISGYVNLQNIYLRLYSSQATFSSNPTSDISNNAKYLLDMETIPVLTSLEGYQIGGENLLRWSKDLPLDINKWTKTNNSEISIGKDGDFSTLDFKLTSHTGDAWYSLRAPLIKNETEYLNKDFSFSCYVKAEDWSAENFGGRVAFSIYGVKTFTAAYRDGFKTFNLTSSSGIDGTVLETVKVHSNKTNNEWIKISFSFKLTDDFFISVDEGSGLSTPIKVSAAEYLGVAIYKRNGTSSPKTVSIKKPKLELGNIPTEWSASPYDINYYDINGANLISEAKLEYLVQGTDNSSGYRIVSVALDPNTFYTLSWEKISAKNNCANFTYQINNGNTVIETKNLSTSLTNYSITFQTGNSSSYKVLLYAGVKGSINSTEILNFHKLKLEKGQISSPYTLTNEQLQDLLEKVKNESQNYADSINKNLVLTTENGIPTITNLDGSKIQFTSYTDFQKYINDLNPKFENLEKGVAGIRDTDLVSINGVLSEYQKQIQLHNENNQDPYIEIFAGFYENTNSMKLTKDRLSFSVNGSEVAYFSSNKMFITQADITTTLRIGTSTTEGGKGFLVFTTVKETGVTVTWSNT